MSSESDDEDEAVHVYPESEGHDLVVDCWCGPEVSDYRPEGGTLLVIHFGAQ